MSFLSRFAVLPSLSPSDDELTKSKKKVPICHINSIVGYIFIIIHHSYVFKNMLHILFCFFYGFTVFILSTETSSSRMVFSTSWQKSTETESENESKATCVHVYI